MLFMSLASAVARSVVICCKKYCKQSPNYCMWHTTTSTRHRFIRTQLLCFFIQLFLNFVFCSTIAIVCFFSQWNCAIVCMPLCVHVRIWWSLLFLSFLISVRSYVNLWFYECSALFFLWLHKKIYKANRTT